MSLTTPEPERTTDSTAEEPRLLTRRVEPDAGSDAPHSSFFEGFARRRTTPLYDDGPRKPLPWRRILVALGSALVLVAAVLIVSGVWLRHAMYDAIPQLDGTLHIEGVGAPVTVARDDRGVPSITAANLDDLLFAQGFVTAQDRLWQMDATRRHAAGELSEILGANFIESDRTQRMLQVRAAADRALTTLTLEQLHQLEAYARGVNAFITQNSDHLPVEFHLLHYKPAPWTPRDSLLISLEMFQYLTTGFPTKLRREALAAHLPANLLADLYPVGSWRDRPPTQPQPDLTAPQPEVLQVPLDRTQSQLAMPADILRVAREFSGACDECRAGSNNWAVASSRSASGSPLISNDMHLALSAPDFWYEAALHAPASESSAALDVTGFTLPGVPLVVVGRNQHVAWSFTNLGADVQDIHIEHLRGTGSSAEFQRPDGSWSPVIHHTEHIRVRFSRDIDLDVRTTLTSIGTATIGTATIETPLIDPLLGSDHRSLSLAWTAYDPANIGTFSLAANTATSGTALVAAMANFGGPSLNLIYADDAGHIGYHAIGRIPIRGPAVQHRRAALTIVPNGPPPPDENSDEGSSEDQAGNATPGPDASEADATPAPTTPDTLTTAMSFTIGSPLSPIPVDALDAAQAWSGYIPYDALPAAVDPADGVLATANARITADDYPYAIALNWAAPYRVERIHKLLAGRSGLTPADMLAVQNDVHSEFDIMLARRVAYALDHAAAPVLAPDIKRLHQAADILRNWNGELAPDAAAPAIVSAIRSEIWRVLLVPQIAAHDANLRYPQAAGQIVPLYQWDAQTVALEGLLQHTPKRWLPKEFTNWNDFLAAVAGLALHDANAPADLTTWRYGRVHAVDIEHPLFSTSPVFDRLLGVTTGSGMRETGGDDTTIKQMRLHFGPSERFTSDLANPDATFGNITTGESGNPASPHYFDQFAAWLAGTTFSMPLHTKSASHTLTLVP